MSWYDDNPSAQPEYDISEILEDIISSKFYESDYKSITQKLLYEDFSYEKAVDEGIAVVAKWGVF